MARTKPLTCDQCSFIAGNVFCGLPKKLLDLFHQKKNSRYYYKKQILHYEDSIATGIFCLKTGRTKIYKTGPEGRQHILKIAAPGDVIGLDAILSGPHYSCTAEMMEDGEVCMVDKSIVLHILEQDPQCSMRVLKMLADQVVLGNSMRLDLAQGSVRERLARLLSTLSSEHGVKDKKGIRIRIPLSREEMADMVGTASETAIRLLKEFKDDQVLEVNGREIIILNRERLEETANAIV